MYYILLLLIALQTFTTLKAESIDFTQTNDRMDVMFPLSESKSKDSALHPTVKQRSEMGYNQIHEWDPLEVKLQPNDFVLKNIINLDDNDAHENEDFDQFKSIDQLDDMQAARLSKYLIKLLERPGIWEAPLILIRDSQDNFEDKPFNLEFDGLQSIAKRSRYYRRYPLKRQNSRSYNNMDYDPYNPCNPTKHDVFQLLVALHDARQGNKSRFVSFCNRRRPASAVYTNIRFLGRRRK